MKHAEQSPRTPMQPAGRALEIVFLEPSLVTPDSRNAKTHTQNQIAQICRSILAFTFVNPVLIDEDRVIIAGHGRVLAALELKLDTIPTITISHLTAMQKRALMLADNKIGMNAAWDPEILRQELLVLSSPEIDLSETAGFSTPEIDLILDGAVGEVAPRDPIDAVDEPIRSKPPITKFGDLWQLGVHRIMCADALAATSYAALLAGEKADLVVTDPPYNRHVDDIGNNGRVKHPEFIEASGEKSRSGFQVFLDGGFGLIKSNVEDGAIIMAFMDWRSIDQLLQTGKTLGFELKNICTWNKLNGGMGAMYRSQTEFIAIFKSGTSKHVNNIMLGRHGRYRTNLWSYAGATMFGRTRKKDLETHPTMKPIAMIVDAIKDCSARDDLVLDSFGGSGTTLLAAERTGRRARLIELDPYYVDVTIERWRKMTGGTPELVAPSAEAA